MSDLDDRLLCAAWKAWDRHPTHAREAGLLEDQVQRVAATASMTGSELRAKITAARRAGMTVDEAVRAGLTP